MKTIAHFCKEFRFETIESSNRILYCETKFFSNFLSEMLKNRKIKIQCLDKRIVGMKILSLYLQTITLLDFQNF